MLGAQTERPAAPNVLLVLTDDQRADALACYGNPHLKTPHLDALAARGVRFTNATVVSSLCCPSRAALLSGKYGHVNGVLGNHPEQDFLAPTRIFPELLQEAGYETASLVNLRQELRAEMEALAAPLAWREAVP